MLTEDEQMNLALKASLTDTSVQELILDSDDEDIIEIITSDPISSIHFC